MQERPVHMVGHATIVDDSDESSTESVPFGPRRRFSLVWRQVQDEAVVWPLDARARSGSKFGQQDWFCSRGR